MSSTTTLPAVEAAFGFGRTVTGGGSATPTPVQNVAGLVAALTALTNSDGPTTIELARGTYDFTFERVQAFTLNAKNLTIRAKEGKLVELRNLGLVFDITRADNILIQDLAFRSTGARNVPRDAISLNVVGVTTAAEMESALTSNVRITHCSFAGYYDIAIDSRSLRGQPKLFATIDHCLFFDSIPGLNPPAPGTPPNPKGPFLFVNRGAINIDAVGDERGSSFVTVANNAFIEVWRRSPRVSSGNVAHIFNNLLFHWGFGNDSDTTDDKGRATNTWVGINVGVAATALIQANRFIPWVKKTDPRKAIKNDTGTSVDITGTPALPNELDNADGLSPAGFPTEPAFGPVDLSLYGASVATPLPARGVNGVDWGALVRSAGLRADPGSDEVTARQRALTFVQPGPLPKKVP